MPSVKPVSSFPPLPKPKIYVGGVFVGEATAVEVKPSIFRLPKRLKVGTNLLTIDPMTINFTDVKVDTEGLRKALGLKEWPVPKRGPKRQKRSK